jgi:hypothetical protein
MISTFAGTFQGAPFGNPNYLKDIARNTFDLTDINAVLDNGDMYLYGLKGTKL